MMLDFFSLPEDDFDTDACGLVDQIDEILSGSDFPEDLGQRSISQKMSHLSDLFDSLACLVLRDIEIASEFNQHLSVAQDRTEFIIDVMENPKNPNAPQLLDDVLSIGEMSIWCNLKAHHAGIVNNLKDQLQIMRKEESKIIANRSQHRVPPLLRLIHSN